MSSDAAHDALGAALDALQSQLTDIAAVQKKQAALRVNVEAAEGTVEVTVNAQGQLVDIAIEKSYLDNHEFDELAGHITEATQEAARQAGQRVAELLAPIREQDKSLPTFSDIVEGMPDLRELMSAGLDAAIPGGPRKGSSAGGVYDDGDDGAQFPTVRR